METTLSEQDQIKEQELIKAIDLGRNSPHDTRSYEEILADIKAKHLKS